MKKYKYTAYPNVESEEGEVEADSIEQAIQIANEQVARNAYFYVTELDLEEVDEE